MAFAGPVWGQTITAPGLVGQPACVGPGETDNPLSGSVSSITASSTTLIGDAYDNLYAALRAQAGDGGPTSFPLRLYVRNGRTNAVVNNLSLSTIDSGRPSINRSSTSWSSLSSNTLYVFTIETTASGFGEARPLLRRCFMTGGTYTPSNESGQPGFVANATSGCFSISPLTFQDVRNCLCGRSRIWTNDAQNTAQRRTLGCADAN